MLKNTQFTKIVISSKSMIKVEKKKLHQIFVSTVGWGDNHNFQRSLVDIKFFARTVSYTFLEMFFKSENSVHGIGCNF